MGDTISLRIEERGAAKVARGVGRVDRSLDAAGKTGKRVSGSMQRGFSKLTSGIGRLASAAAGLGVAFGAKAILSFDDAMGQLQADMGLTTKDAKKLRSEILATSAAVGVTKEEVLSGAKEWQDYTGVLGDFRGEMMNVAKIHKATGTPMKSLATISAALVKSLGMSPKGAVEALGKLNEQSRAGAINMQKAADVLPELLAAGSGYGFSGERGVKQMGMLLQVAGQSSGGKADVAKTGAMALMRDLNKNAKKLKKMKISIFDPDDPKKLRDIEKIMAEIMAKTGGAVGGKRGLSTLFGDESLKTALGFKNAGTAQTSLAAGDRGGMATVEQQLALRVNGVAATSEKLKKTLAGLDSQFQTLGKKAMTWVAENPMLAAGGAVGAYAGAKVLPKVVGGIFNRLLGKKGGGLGGILGGGGSKVFVTNWPGSLGGAGGAASAGGKLGGIAQKAGGLMAAAGVGWAIGRGIAKVFNTDERLSELMVSGQRSAAKGRANKHGQSAIGERLQSQAAQLAKFRADGKTQFGTAGGMKDLTQGNAMAVLVASAKRQGATEETIKAMIPVLQKLTASIDKGPTVTVVAPGIDNPKVSTSRGAKK